MDWGERNNTLVSWSNCIIRMRHTHQLFRYSMHEITDIAKHIWWTGIDIYEPTYYASIIMRIIAYQNVMKTMIELWGVYKHNRRFISE